MIPVALIIVFGGLLLSLLVLWLARSASVEYSGARERLLGPGAEMLAYDLPHGQDPARLAAALRSAGFLAIEEGAGTVHRILVGCPSGRFRDCRTRALTWPESIEHLFDTSRARAPAPAPV